MNRKTSNGSRRRRHSATRVPVTVRVPEDLIAKIDQELDELDIPLSRNNWFLEAALEKLRRSETREAHGSK